MKSTISALPSTRRLTSSGPVGVSQTTATNSTAVTSSTIGYRTEIGSPHWRQRPRSAIQLRTGMLSYQRRPRPQRGQRDGGHASDSPRGSR